jgi:pimeloyl-ACP methyl ester carboxylesterase
MPDVRAHGQSDGPADPAAYSLNALAADMVVVLDDLGIKRAHVLGYSMGGVIGYTLARHYSQRLRSLAVGGTSPYPDEPSDEPSFLLQLYERAAQEGVDVLVEGISWRIGCLTRVVRVTLAATATMASVMASDQRAIDSDVRTAHSCSMG